VDPSLQHLIDRLNQLSDEFRELRDGVLRAAHIADEDPEMALIRSRKVLEYLIRDVFVRRIQEPPGTRPLENLIQRLVKDGHFPPRLEAYTETIRKLGNVGAHHFGEKVSPLDVYQSLTQLIPILEWYFEVERPDAGVDLDLPHEPNPTRIESESEDGGRTSKARIPVVPKGLRSFDANDSEYFLQLLPGPRDKSGLPESIRFWKYRIESEDAPAFTVGVIYGPSGCGKSSLVKAGLMPRLAQRIISVYVEAATEETEVRILNGLNKRFSGMTADMSLAQAIIALQQRIKPQQKVVIFLDQFEQWLHAHPTESDTELAQALRQCDGDHAQCVLLLRDEFWVSLTRFMDDLGIGLIHGRNAALVDHFASIHARMVLSEFGRSYGRLPDPTQPLTEDQDAFLDDAVEGLCQNGRVVPIRLALFAEMVKDRRWTPATLEQFGGTEGVGAAYLNETFESASLRPHQEAARAVLEALLPETGTDIKGHVRSHRELLYLSGYAHRSNEFDDLLRVLEGEFRLISPTELERPDENERGAYSSVDCCYQLTHDYVVPWLRSWLRRKKSETLRGKAEIRLVERTELWAGNQDRRNLPEYYEWLFLRMLTNKRRWTLPQKKMMAAALTTHAKEARSFTRFLVISSLVISFIIINYISYFDHKAVFYTAISVSGGLASVILAGTLKSLVGLIRRFAGWVVD
jgi:hypothetical protein